MFRAATVALAAVLTLPGAAAAQDAVFRPGGELGFGGAARPQAVATGDFDSDGRRDLAVADYADDRLHVRLANGDGTYRESSVPDLEFAEDVVVADFNADGSEDLAVAAEVSTDREIAILLGEGDGRFRVAEAVDLGSYDADALAVGDLNGDGRADLVASTGQTVASRLGSGDGSFAGGVDIEFSAHSTASAVTGDFDGDGIQDVAVSLESALAPAYLAFLRGKGNGAFEGAKLSGLPNDSYHLATGDFDADGREDVAATIYAEDRVSVRLGNGDGTFDDGPPDVPVGDEPWELAVGDFDADGREDLAVANVGSDRVSVRRGAGDGTFRAAGEVEVGTEPQSLAAGDLDRDGRQDLVVANYGERTLSVRLGAGRVPAGNLLVNGGFEQGLAARLPTQSPDIPGWTTTGGMTFVRYAVAPDLGFPTHVDAPRYANGGLNFLWGGVGGVTTASQTVSVAGSAATIDAGRATARLSAYLGGALAYPDHMRATATFLDAAGTGLGHLVIGPVGAADRRNVTTLLRRAGSAPVPPRTRRIKVTLTSTDADDISSAMADNVALALAVAPAPPPPPAARPPSFGAATRVTLRLAARRVRARGPVPVAIANANAFPVTGTLAGRRPVKPARRNVALAPGARRVIRLPLAKPLRRKRALRLTLVVEDPAGNRRTVRATLRPRRR